MIRHARPDEATAVHTLVRAAYAAYVPRIGAEPGPMGDDYGRRIADRQAFVLEHDHALIGALVLEDGADALLLENVAVHPAHHGKGHGRMLLAFAEQQARAAATSGSTSTHAMMTEIRFSTAASATARPGAGSITASRAC